MNELRIHRFNGTETFPIETARMFTVGTGDDLTLWFEFEATSAGSKPNADTSEYPARPNAELGIRVNDFDAGNLAGMQLSHPGTFHLRWTARSR